MVDAGLPKRGILIRMGSFFQHGIQSFAVPRSRTETRDYRGRILYFAASKNQRDALAPVAAETPEAQWLGVKGFGEHAFPLSRAYCMAIPFLPFVLYQYIRSEGYRRKSFSYAFDMYWFAYGYYFVWRLLLRRLHPAMLVVSNDHGVWTRTPARAAMKEDIPTAYLQHASVSGKFPPLMFDYAFLDGRDALQKYDSIGSSNTKVFLVGIPKFDHFFNRVNNNPSIRSVGVCLNTLDPADRVDEICRSLVSVFPQLRFSMRPHPADKNKPVWQERSARLGMEYSDSVKETSFEFMTHQDAIIVGESNILLEAVLMNIVPLYYDFPGGCLDNYGFLSQGLIHQYHSEPEEIIESLKRMLDNKPFVRMAAKPYVASVGTEFDGKSSPLMAGVIRQIAADGSILPGAWKRVTGVQLEAYELE